MKYKLVVYSNDKVIYLVVDESEVDQVYLSYRNSLVLILNISEQFECKKM